jgi:hypothetical protein
MVKKALPFERVQIPETNKAQACAPKLSRENRQIGMLISVAAMLKID